LANSHAAPSASIAILVEPRAAACAAPGNGQEQMCQKTGPLDGLGAPALPPGSSLFHSCAARPAHRTRRGFSCLGVVPGRRSGKPARQRHRVLQRCGHAAREISHASYTSRPPPHCVTMILLARRAHECYAIAFCRMASTADRTVG
jgi:hypothetical protein